MAYRASVRWTHTWSEGADFRASVMMLGGPRVTVEAITDGAALRALGAIADLRLSARFRPTEAEECRCALVRDVARGRVTKVTIGRRTLTIEMLADATLDDVRSWFDEGAA